MRRFPPSADDPRAAPGLAGVMTTPSFARPLGGAAIVVTLSLLAGCQAFGINEQYSAEYATLDDTRTSWDDARIPDLVPEDAERIRIGYNTVDEGAMLAFQSAGGITAEYCEPAEIVGSPAYEPAWWPDDTLPDDGFTCGNWTVVEVADEFLVWD
jgi:hypothetical protein